MVRRRYHIVSLPAMEALWPSHGPVCIPTRERGNEGGSSLASAPSAWRTAHGFTLLEMLLVIFLMALVASTGLMLTEGVETQAKYDETKRRMELIRKAIVGDPTRTVNGAPEISGFVADMGRLPGCLRELLERLDCGDPAAALPVWTHDPSSGIGFGWRGPYLQVLPEIGGALRFRDGYGNRDDTAADDAANSGWIWRLYVADDSLATPAATNPFAIVRLQSLGFDGTERYPPGDMDAAAAVDRPIPLIIPADWQVQLPAAVGVTFINQHTSDARPATAVNLRLRLYRSDLTDYFDADDGSNDYLTLAADSVLPGNNRRTETFRLDNPPSLPMGIRGYAVVCNDVPPADPDDFVVFDGDCDAGNGVPGLSSVRSVAVVPRQILSLSLDWIIQ
ncbi:MAG: prepilin-type N-terminal cleavage/methylation domain-containing protein [Methylomonas sp.]|nr:prepilin-type N-terminal cleavage/methylation domain-containing protein [Methylomonas sp.]PPD21151.1 MAG: hypothetical protein CTY23_06590 [Methylomonas sp.]PPD27586.1 MAG: hypothetical protein CTY22_01625 [Methylomonas sp.]PPD39582.1 MAG: hypothetical protein CTY21_01620 [Methylomonas sp.]PPD55833.1 MAG: hypothetical protein CTY11_00890 [Methylomonas sp.]